MKSVICSSSAGRRRAPVPARGLGERLARRPVGLRRQLPGPIIPNSLTYVRLP